MHHSTMTLAKKGGLPSRWIASFHKLNWEGRGPDNPGQGRAQKELGGSWLKQGWDRLGHDPPNFFCPRQTGAINLLIPGVVSNVPDWLLPDHFP